MAAITTILAVASLAVAAGSAYASYKQGQEAQQAQRQQNQVSAATRQAQQQQSIRDQVRQDRIRRAQIINMSAQTGTVASSGEYGAIGSSSSQAGLNESNINATAMATNTYLSLGQEANSAMGRASLFGGVASLAGRAAGGFASTYSAQKDFNNWFGYNPPTGINAPPKG